MQRQAFITCTALLFLAMPILGTSFTFGLAGSQEVPPVQTAASGACAAVLSEEEPPKLIVSCDHNVGNPSAAHIHRGRPTENGPILFTFDDPEDLQASFEITDQNQLGALFTQNLYVNVHSADHPTGEIRGQIRFQSAIDAGDVRFSPLAGEQEVPPVESGAAGDCVSVLDDEEFFVVCTHDLVDVTGAHIHRAARGENGPIVLDLGDAASPIFFEAELAIIDPTGTLAADYRDGLLYVNVHSSAQPSGQIRGQLDGCVNRERSLCLNRNRFQVEIDWNTSDASGSGTGVLESADSGMFWFFDPSNLELLVKVINGCALNNNYWLFYSATTDVGFALRVTDTRSGRVKTYLNTLGQSAEPKLDTSAFDSCP